MEAAGDGRDGRGEGGGGGVRGALLGRRRISFAIVCFGLGRWIVSRCGSELRDRPHFLAASRQVKRRRPATAPPATSHPPEHLTAPTTPPD